MHVASAATTVSRSSAASVARGERERDADFVATITWPEARQQTGGEPSVTGADTCAPRIAATKAMGVDRGPRATSLAELRARVEQAAIRAAIRHWIRRDGLHHAAVGCPFDLRAEAEGRHLRGELRVEV